MTLGRAVAVVCVAAGVGASVAAVALRSPAAPVPPPPGDPFARWMFAPYPAADGFDPSAPGTATAIGAGRVLSADDRAVVVEHLYYENHRRRVVRSRFPQVADLRVRAGALVTRGQPLGGAIGPGGVAVIHASGDAEDAAAFIAARRDLPVPQAEPRVLLIDSALGRARLYERGVRRGEWSAGLGQIEGCKEQRDDGRTPCGMYFVTARSTGPFTGPMAPYFGGHWLPINYPNPWDAERGLAADLITADDRDRIAAAWSARQATPRGTRLGDGIGLHGWIEDWTGEAGPRGSLGCAFFRRDDIRALYPRLAPGTMVVLW